MLCLHTLEARTGQNLCLDNASVVWSLAFRTILRGQRISHSPWKKPFCLYMFTSRALLPLKVYSARDKCTFPSFTRRWMAYMGWMLLLPRIFLPTGCDIKVFSSLTGENLSILHSCWEGAGGITPLVFSPEQSC